MVDGRESYGFPSRSSADRVRVDPSVVPDLAIAPFKEEIKRGRVSTSRLTQPLTDVQEQFVAEQLDLTMQRLKLQWEAEPTPLFGTRPLADNSIKKYQTHYRAMELFLKRIGDFESLIILSEKAPSEFCPSMSADSVIAFIDYKVMPEGTPVHITAASASNRARIGPVMDVFTKRPILSTATWRDPENCNQFLGAISRLHLARKQSGQYYEPCPRCLAEFAAERAGGCVFHSQRRLWRCGCPRELDMVKNRYERLSRFDLPDYQPQGASGLLPHELIQIRTSLLCRNLKSGYRLWTMFLFHIVLMLRSKEGIEFRFQDFVPCMTTVSRSTGDLMTIGVRIKGKSDESFKYMIIHRNDEIPELCLVRHLLGWIYLSGNTDGYLFTDKHGQPFKYRAFNNQYVN